MNACSKALYIAVLAGCSKAAEHKPPSVISRPQPQLAVTVDGKPVSTALAWKQRDGSVTLTASSVPIG